MTTVVVEVQRGCVVTDHGRAYRGGERFRVTRERALMLGDEVAIVDDGASMRRMATAQPNRADKARFTRRG